MDVGTCACAACDWDRERDMERSEVGVLSSTAELEGCCWPAVRVSIWACCWRIMLRRRFYNHRQHGAPRRYSAYDPRTTCPSCSYSSS